MKKNNLSLSKKRFREFDLQVQHKFFNDFNKKSSCMNKKIVLLPIAMLTFSSFSVFADELDTLQFRVGENIVRESNVFRLSDSTNAQTLLGNSNRSDTIAITTLGVKLNKSYSLQRVELDVSAEDHHYSRYSKLNFNALNYLGAFRWSVTPFLYGNITANRRDYVDTFADVQNTGQLN